MDTPLVCFTAACSKMGKTTFLEKLICVFHKRGVRIGVIKSDVHGFSIDVPKKDSWRLTQAGAQAAAIIGPDRFALIQSTRVKKNLDDVAALFEDIDLVLVEGFKNADKPHIEIVRSEKASSPATEKKNLIALVTDIPSLCASVPCFSLDDASGVADLITRLYLKGTADDSSKMQEGAKQ
jgi:molybdopterin-guanine dinucleotide biosynthesis protein B